MVKEKDKVSSYDQIFRDMIMRLYEGSCEQTDYPNLSEIIKVTVYPGCDEFFSGQVDHDYLLAALYERINNSLYDAERSEVFNIYIELGETIAENGRCMYQLLVWDTKVITKEEGHDLAKKYNRQSEIGKPPSGKGKKIENGKARAGLGIRMIRNFTAMYEGRLECYLNGNNMFVTEIIFDKERYLEGQRKLVEM